MLDSTSLPTGERENYDGDPMVTAPAELDSRTQPWLFSRGLDLAAFLGSALASLALLGVGWAAGLADAPSPDWLWIVGVLLVDVAHVWSTGFLVYTDGQEFRRRPVLYTLVPVLGFGCAFVAYGLGAAVFWRALAYLAVFHFVRQQYGWVALYRSRAGEFDRAGHWLDTVTIYATTLYPLLWWHANLPRRFNWFVDGDFFAIPAVARWLAPLYWSILLAYGCRSLWARRRGRGNPGKDLVVATTAICWYAGIVAFDSDYAFTATNVLIHGVPYLVLVYVTVRNRPRRETLSGRLLSHGWWPYLMLLWAIAFVEELVWDRAIWHDRAWLFGGGWEAASWGFVLVPLLATPQITHYVLDGFIWKRGVRERTG